MGGNVLGNMLNNISADVIFCVCGQNIFEGGRGWLRTKFSCEVHLRLYIMHQSFVKQDGDLLEMCCVVFMIRRKYRCLIDIDKHGSAV